ncbi:MAG TPA: C39 family peptidase, partial [Candidatus Dormibacteraeota bacterium]|nr:C39 family peptidase [Candidatus Dormibacteraeota bacterium]
MGEPGSAWWAGRRRWVTIGVAAVVLVALVPAGTGAKRQRPPGAPVAATTTADLPSATDTTDTPDSPTPSPTPTDTPTPGAPVPPVLPAAAPAHPPAAPPPAAPPPPPGPPPVTIAVPWYHQQYNLSCEESSLSMVLAFFGHPTTEQQIFGYVTIDSAHPAAGVPGGGDPYVAFVGDPNGSEVLQTGYGVYWPRIAAAAGYFGAAVSQTGEGVAPAAIYAAVRAGHPALVWVTFDLRPHPRNDYQAWDGR